MIIFISMLLVTDMWTAKPHIFNIKLCCARDYVPVEFYPEEIIILFG
jgi:hypothetical protein